MKDQYFGDINDYYKYGLLRTLQSKVPGRFLVAWMLTPNDGSGYGASRDYLVDPKNRDRYDPELFAGLARLVPPPLKVSLIEETRLLGDATYYSAVVPDGGTERNTWWQGLFKEAQNADLVFLDPDNGIEVPSKPIGRKRSSKYVTWREIEKLWDARCSVLIYQHFRREPREAFAERLVSELQERTGACCTAALSSPNVLFLLAAQERHQAGVRDVIPLLQQRWNSQIGLLRLADQPLQPAAAGPSHLL